MTNPPNIVIVDDDPQVLRFLSTTLERNGYAVTATTSGTKSLALIKQHPPDLLILDLNMPEPDGFDILRIERSQFPYLRILVISGYLEGRLLEASKFVGAIATLEKPITPEALASKVREILGR